MIEQLPTDDILDFLETCIAEDEQCLRELGIYGGYWHMHDPTVYAVAHRVTGSYDQHIAAFLTQFDPARAQRETATKRALIAGHVRYKANVLLDAGTDDERLEAVEYWSCLEEDGVPGEAWPCDGLRRIASVYQRHPNYRADLWTVTDA